jgi:dTMP kinase
MKKGLFLSFEGPEGSGKSTQIKLLYRYLKRRGLPVIRVRQPGQTRIGEKIRKILLNPEYREISDISEALLYMVSHSQLLEEIVVPYLKRGYIILCDRFLDSTFVYQGFGLGVDLDLIKRIANYICKKITPDLTILLDIPVEEGLRRLKKSPDRIERRKLKFHRRVREGYLKLAKIYPERIKIVPVEKDLYATQRKIRELVLEKLCLLKR